MAGVSKKEEVMLLVGYVGIILAYSLLVYSKISHKPTA